MRWQNDSLRVLSKGQYFSKWSTTSIPSTNQNLSNTNSNSRKTEEKNPAAVIEEFNGYVSTQYQHCSVPPRCL